MIYEDSNENLGLPLDVASNVDTKTMLTSVRGSIGELEGLTKSSLICALVTAHTQLSALERSNVTLHESLSVGSSRCDLHARRCQLAVEICRDDEGGLSASKLNEIATIIWPEPVDITKKPTEQKPVTRDILESELFQQVGTAGYILGLAKGILDSVTGSADPVTVGSSTRASIKMWNEKLDVWRKETEYLKHL